MMNSESFKVGIIQVKFQGSLLFLQTLQINL